MDLMVRKTYYENAMKLSGDSTGDTYEGQTRLKEDVEIHYFATMGALIALTCIELDANSDGDVAEDEIQSFTGICQTTDASYGKNEIATADWIEFVTDKGTGSEKVYLLNMSTGKCRPQTATPKYGGLWDGGGLLIYLTLSIAGSLTPPHWQHEPLLGKARSVVNVPLS